MAIQREVLQDITKYKTTVIGPFDKRQCLFIVIGAVAAVLTYFTLGIEFVKDFTIIISAIVFVIFALPGFFYPYGVPLEKFIYTTFKLYILTPKNRVYKTEFEMENSEPIPTRKPGFFEKRKLKKELKEHNIEVYN